jgi:hypothetical protein
MKHIEMGLVQTAATTVRAGSVRRRTDGTGSCPQTYRETTYRTVSTPYKVVFLKGMKGVIETSVRECG